MRFGPLAQIAFTLLLSSCWTVVVFADELKPGDSREIRMSLADDFVVRGSDRWKVDVGQVETLRFAELYIIPKQGTDWSVACRFLSDTPDIAKFNTWQKMYGVVRDLVQQKAPRAVEKDPEIKSLDTGGRYGFCATLTDQFLTQRKDLRPGQFRYTTMGMLRLSDDSAMSFVICYNEPNAQICSDVMAYLQSFVRPVPGATTQP